MRDEPRIGMTMGDPEGVGPELVVRALAADGDAGVTVYGDAGLLAREARRRGLAVPPGVTSITSLDAAVPGAAGTLDARTSGAAQIGYLEAAVADARAGRLDALVTAPISKSRCHAAGFNFPGHTEFLAERLGAARVAMMIAGPHLRVVPATIHVALARVFDALGPAVESAILLTVRALANEFGIMEPRVAVAGLNPHAGEQGAFGDEEQRLIAPAIERAREQLQREGRRFALSGPHVPDAVYRAACAPPFGDGRYDAVVGMYHDQALIPVKMVDFDEAVNVTLGLPLPRTSPDHGVGWDVAGTPAVRDGSFRAALRLARLLASARARR